MNNPQSLIADVAEKYVGVKETSRNQSPEISKFWESTWYPTGDENREPWCCSFVVYCIQEADHLSESINLRYPPKMPSVAGFIRWASKPENGCQIFEWDKHSQIMIPQRGDIVTFEFKSGNHIGIVGSSPYSRPSTGSSYVKTIEGNTGSDGGRDGDGVYYKERARDLCQFFIRLPVVAKA